MLASVMRRALSGCLVVLGVATLTFTLLRFAPGDPAQRLLGPGATAAQVAALRHTLGLDRPLPAQYATWLELMVRGDWGRSIATGRPVSAMLAEAWGPTVRLVGVSLILSYGLGLIVAMAQAARRGSRVDTALTVVVVSLFATPGYWLGLMLVAVFTYWLRMFPAFGAAGLDVELLSGWQRAVDALRHLALPVATLTLTGVGGAARFARGSLVDAIGQPFTTTARAKGVSPRRVMWHHVLRNALIPLLVLLGLSLPALFSGAVFVEAVFAWPGLGRVLVAAVQARDYPVVMAATTVSAALVVVGNILADVAVGVVDPRIRHS